MNRVVSLRVVELAGALREPAANRLHTWQRRAGLLLRLTDETGLEGQGEASPLPGFSPDSIEDCRDALQRLSVAALGAELSANRSLRGRLRAAGALLPLDLPAASFALQTALLDLWARQQGQPAWLLLRREVRPGFCAEPSTLPLATWVGAATDPDLEAKASAALATGARTLKIKLGLPGAFEQELAALKALRSVVGSGIALRLDANAAWSCEQVGPRLAALRLLGPEFVEEPCNLDELPRLNPDLPAVALDESLATVGALLPLRERLERANVRFVVLKPMALGGLVRCLELGEEAQALGLGTVVTHLLDGPVALAAAAALALAIGSEGVAQGLSLHAGLAAWPPSAVEAIQGPKLVALPLPGLGLPELESSP